MDVESSLPPLMYNPPPYTVAEQESKVVDVRVSVLEDERVDEIAPPFSDEQFVNVASEID